MCQLADSIAEILRANSFEPLGDVLLKLELEPHYQCPGINIKRIRIGKQLIENRRGRVAKNKTAQCLLIIITLFLLLSLVPVQSASADTITTPGRKLKITEKYTEYEWWLLSWAENELACTLFIDHEGNPSFDEIYLACGNQIFEDWLEHPVCESATTDGDNSHCEGYYLHFVNAQPAERELILNLPVPSVQLKLSDCTANRPNDSCPQIPSLIFKAIEPLEDEKIEEIHIQYGNSKLAYQGSAYALPLTENTINGQLISFWATSSYGDTSQIYEALIRVLPVNDEDGQAWQLDILSSQWQGEQPVVMSLDWWALPPTHPVEKWLSSPQLASELSSQTAYHYLAGQLIQSGLANASDCADGGLTTSGYASQCGLENASDEIVYWQNSFDKQILATAQTTGVPANLIKNLIAQESQFWPGFYELSPKEYGLGRLTVEGADTILLWNTDFFATFCPQLLLDTYCTNGYAQMAPGLQAMLRGALG